MDSWPENYAFSSILIYKTWWNLASRKSTKKLKTQSQTWMGITLLLQQKTAAKKAFICWVNQKPTFLQFPQSKVSMTRKVEKWKSKIKVAT